MNPNLFNRKIISNRFSQHHQPKCVSFNYPNIEDLSVKVNDENYPTKHIDNFQMTLNSITNQLNNISLNSKTNFHRKNLSNFGRKSLKITNDIVDFGNFKKTDKNSFKEKNANFKNSAKQSNSKYKRNFYRIINENSFLIKGIEKIFYSEKELKEENKSLKEQVKFLLDQIKKFQKCGLSVDDDPQIDNEKNEEEIKRIKAYYEREIQSIIQKISILERQYNALKQAHNDLKIKYNNEKRINTIQNNNNCKDPYYKENVFQLIDNIDSKNTNYNKIKDNSNISYIHNSASLSNKRFKTSYINLKASFNNNNSNNNYKNNRIDNSSISIFNTNRSHIYNENGNNSFGNTLYYKRKLINAEIIDNKNNSYDKTSRAKSTNYFTVNNKLVEHFHKASLNNIKNGNYNLNNTSLTKKDIEKNENNEFINKNYIESYGKKRNSSTTCNIRNNFHKKIFTLSGESNFPLPKTDTSPLNLYYFPKTNYTCNSNENKTNIFKFNIIKIKFSNLSFQISNDSTFNSVYNSTFNHLNDIFISISNGFFLITGEKTNYVFYYNEDTNTVYDLIKLNHFHAKGSLLILNDNDLLCISGINSTSVELYSINNQNLKDLPNMNFSHSESSFLIFNKRVIFSFFGFDYTNNRYISEIEYLEYKSNKYKNWGIIQLNDFILNLRGQSIFFRNKNNISDEKIEYFIVGGYNELENNNGLILIDIIEIEGNNGESKYEIKFKKFNENKETNRNKIIDGNKSHRFVFNGGFYQFLDENKNSFYSYNSDEKFNIHIIDNSTLKHTVYKNKLKK